MVATHNIEKVFLKGEFIYLQIDGKEYKIVIDKVSKKLQTANEIQRDLFTISPAGYGIHWPLIDEDLSVDALLKVADY